MSQLDDLSHDPLDNFDVTCGGFPTGRLDGSIISYANGFSVDILNGTFMFAMLNDLNYPRMTLIRKPLSPWYDLNNIFVPLNLDDQWWDILMPEQLYSEPFLYVNDLNLSWLSNTTLGISVGQCRDNSVINGTNIGNVFDIFVNSPIVINSATIGANGIDAGSLSPNTWYFVYVIADITGVNPAAGLISISQNPALPFGYGMSRRIGWAFSGASSVFSPFIQTGSQSRKVYQWTAPVSVLTNGGATSFTTINLQSAVPPAIPSQASNILVKFGAIFKSASILIDAFTLKTTGVPFTVGSSFTGNSLKVSPAVQSFPSFYFMAGKSASITGVDYMITSVSGSTLSLNVSGYVDEL